MLNNNCRYECNTEWACCPDDTEKGTYDVKITFPAITGGIGAISNYCQELMQQEGERLCEENKVQCDEDCSPNVDRGFQTGFTEGTCADYTPPTEPVQESIDGVPTPGVYYENHTCVEDGQGNFNIYQDRVDYRAIGEHCCECECDCNDDCGPNEYCSINDCRCEPQMEVPPP